MKHLLPTFTPPANRAGSSAQMRLVQSSCAFAGLTPLHQKMEDLREVVTG